MSRQISLADVVSTTGPPPLATRAWNWLKRLVVQAMPERRAYALCVVRVAMGLGVLALAPYAPRSMQSLMLFFGNMFFYVGVFAVLAPFEAGIMTGVLDKADALLLHKKAGDV